MPTIVSGDSATFTLDAFGYVAVIARGDGSLAAVSRAQNLKSNVSISRLASVQYGPYGVPMDFEIVCTNGSIEYATTYGYTPGDEGLEGGTGLTGGDVTAVTEEVDPVNVGYRPLTFTRHGVVWTCSYNPDGSRASETALSGDLVVTYAYTTDGGFASVSGNYHDGIGYRMTWSTFKDIKTALAGVSGFVARVTDLTTIYGTDGNALAVQPIQTLEWAGTYARAPQGITFASYQAKTYSNASAGESSTLHSLVVPQELLGPYGWIEMYTPANFFADNESQSKQVNVQLNGSAIVQSTSGAVTASGAQITDVLSALGSVSAQFLPNTGGANIGSYNSGVVPILPAINSDTTDLTFTTTLQTTSAAGAGTALTLYLFRVTVKHP